MGRDKYNNIDFEDSTAVGTYLLDVNIFSSNFTLFQKYIF